MRTTALKKYLRFIIQVPDFDDNKAILEKLVEQVKGAKFVESETNPAVVKLETVYLEKFLASTNEKPKKRKATQ